jgi:F-type H+-transporting ATPase subunit delta
MDRNRVTVRYAKAYVEMASEQGTVMECYHDMSLLLASLTNYDNFRAFIVDPSISHHEKMLQLIKFFGADFQPLTMKFLEMIFSKYRQEYFIDICRNCVDMIRRMEGITKATLTTAYELNSKLIEQLKSKFELGMKSTIELTVNTDPSLIGGFIFTIDDEQYDASIASRLSSVKKHLQV